MKLRVALLFGGRSAEHEVSCVSAAHVAAALDPNRYEVVPIAITRTGDWVLPEGFSRAEGPLISIFGPFGRPAAGAEPADPGRFDVVFPVLHGPYGEDGTVQGLLELAGVAYVGSGVLGSAVGMDKAMMKLAFTAAGILSPKYLVVRRMDWESGRQEQLERAASLGFPSFSKPANLGSSVGISKCSDDQELAAGIDQAFEYDEKMLVEQGIIGREIECAVLGNHHPEASVCGEVVPGRQFYDYQAKYLDPASKTIVPAYLPQEASDQIRSEAVRAFRAVGAAGLARVDFFYTSSGEVLINEINTMPGFTEISMFPKLWAASGLGYPALIDRLIQLALERHRSRP
ncbi:MAG: D-alanine--D-alanine ligase family protein [Actinomycetota bacterium]